MRFKWKAGVFSDSLHQVGEKEQIFNVVTIGNIEMESFRVGFDPFDVGFEIGKVGRPERRGTL